MRPQNKPRTGGRILVDQLRLHGADLAFGVPGESYLAVLDALHGTPEVRFVTCRQEGGAAMMADAYGKQGQIICAFWHNRALLLPFFYRYRMKLKRLAAMVSRSRDGQFLADFLERFGFRTV